MKPQKRLLGKVLNRELEIIGRSAALFDADIQAFGEFLTDKVQASRFLVIGGAGSIGQAVTKELFARDPRLLHVVDISENNLVEVVRDLRSTIGYGTGEFATFAIDAGSAEFEYLMRANGPYDFVLNLSALKHVRSESDPFTLMRLINTNITNTVKTFRASLHADLENYFCVSTDKAANPVNMMGASKRIMELFMMRESLSGPVSMARFANVAFSDGSLLHGFKVRLEKLQPLSAPTDVERYFVTPEESGQLCMMSALLGDPLDVFFPKLTGLLKLTKFSDLAVRFLESKGLEPVICQTEDEARQRVKEFANIGKWPLYLFESDTTGEKGFEEFFTADEILDLNRFASLGVIKNAPRYNAESLDQFELELGRLIDQGHWTKLGLVSLFSTLLPDFGHLERGKYLDQRM